jgi:hypothetical protein
MLDAQLGYWRTQLSDLPAVHNLPLDYTRPATQSLQGRYVVQQLDARLSSALTALAQDQQVTLFMLLQTAFSMLLGRFSQSDDVVMGTPIAGRQQSALEPLIGFFVNTLVLRTEVSSGCLEPPAKFELRAAVSNHV